MRILTAFGLSKKVAFAAFLSSVLWIAGGAARAHEVLPAIADMTEVDGRLEFQVTVNLEGIIAGIDLTEVSDTNAAPQAADYDALRAEAPDVLAADLVRMWPVIASNINVMDGDVKLSLELLGIDVPEVGDVEITRASVLRFAAVPTANVTDVTVGWSSAYGTLVLRQQGVENPYTGYLEAGATSDPIPLSGGGAVSGWQTFVDYIPIGVDHIVPKGLDHILFVLGLFFLSMKMRPLLWQVSAFTLAHTITLGLASMGWVSVPGSIVEPLIAASIVYVAVENILSDGLSRWRPAVVFGFGLLHGLGFASVLGEFGLPEGAFFPALIGFNIGVELGQLSVIAVAFALLGYWFGSRPWYRSRISTPASVVIAAIGAFWVVERTLL